MRHRLPLLSLFLAAGPALAVQVSSTVQLSGVGYQLRDLDPDDGILASATMVSRSLTMNSLVYSYGHNGRQFRVGHPYFGGADGQATTSMSRDTAFASNLAFAANEMLWLSSGGTSTSGFVRYDGYSGSARFKVAYRLAPHTEMHWNGSYYATANAGLGDVVQSAAWLEFGERSNTFRAVAYSDPSLEAGVAHRTGNLDFFLRNDTDRSQRVVATFGAFSAGGSAPDAYRSSVSSVTPVPEPETYAMLLAGLGAVGFAVRRRRSTHDGLPQSSILQGAAAA